MKILCTGDLHLGRRSTGLPAALGDRAFSAADAWLGIVELAVAERVDLVALSGDVVDYENRFFEAYGPLERGLRRLAAEDIDTVAVAGNHDFGVLPRLADEMGGARFRVLGRGGRWERLTLARDGVALLHVDGWSFPGRHHRDDPLADYPRSPGNGVPVLALLHGDLDAPGSVYAPVRLSDLLASPTSIWLLGHVHAPALRGGDAVAAPQPGATTGEIRAPPRARSGRPAVLYPGSPLALHPGETGAHGPWLLRVEPGRAVEARQVASSPVRYETVRLDLTGVVDVADVDSLAIRAIEECLDSAVIEGAGSLRVLSARVIAAGRTALYREVAGRLRGLLDLTPSREDAVAGIDRVAAAARPAIDLDNLARGADPPAILARVLLAIERGERTTELETLLVAAGRRAEQVARARVFQELRSPDTDRIGASVAGEATPAAADPLVLEIERQAWALLDALWAQREEP